MAEFHRIQDLEGVERPLVLRAEELRLVESGLEIVVEVLAERYVLPVMTGQHFEMLSEL